MLLGLLCLLSLDATLFELAPARLRSSAGPFLPRVIRVRAQTIVGNNGQSRSAHSTSPSQTAGPIAQILRFFFCLFAASGALNMMPSQYPLMQQQQFAMPSMDPAAMFGSLQQAQQPIAGYAAPSAAYMQPSQFGTINSVQQMPPLQQQAQLNPLASTQQWPVQQQQPILSYPAAQQQAPIGLIPQQQFATQIQGQLTPQQLQLLQLQQQQAQLQALQQPQQFALPGQQAPLQQQGAPLQPFPGAQSPLQQQQQQQAPFQPLPTQLGAPIGGAPVGAGGPQPAGPLPGPEGAADPAAGGDEPPFDTQQRAGGRPSAPSLRGGPLPSFGSRPSAAAAAAAFQPQQFQRPERPEQPPWAHEGGSAQAQAARPPTDLPSFQMPQLGGGGGGGSGAAQALNLPQQPSMGELLSAVNSMGGLAHSVPLSQLGALASSMPPPPSGGPGGAGGASSSSADADASSLTAPGPEPSSCDEVDYECQFRKSCYPCYGDRSLPYCLACYNLLKCGSDPACQMSKAKEVCSQLKAASKPTNSACRLLSR